MRGVLVILLLLCIASRSDGASAVTRKLQPPPREPMEATMQHAAVAAGVGAGIGTLGALITQHNDLIGDYSSTGSSAGLSGNSFGDRKSPLFDFVLGAAAGTMSYFSARLSNGNDDSSALSKFLLGGGTGALIPMLTQKKADHATKKDESPGPTNPKDALKGATAPDAPDGLFLELEEGLTTGGKKKKVTPKSTASTVSDAEVASFSTLLEKSLQNSNLRNLLKSFVGSNTPEDCDCEIKQIDMDQFVGLFPYRNTPLTAEEITRVLGLPIAMSSKLLINAGSAVTAEGLFSFFSDDGQFIRTTAMIARLQATCEGNSLDLAALVCKIFRQAAGPGSKYFCDFMYYLEVTSQSARITAQKAEEHAIHVEGVKDVVVKDLFNRISIDGRISTASVQRYYGNLCRGKAIKAVPVIKDVGLVGIFKPYYEAYKTCLSQ